MALSFIPPTPLVAFWFPLRLILQHTNLPDRIRWKVCPQFRKGIAVEGLKGFDFSRQFSNEQRKKFLLGGSLTPTPPSYLGYSPFDTLSLPIFGLQWHETGSLFWWAICLSSLVTLSTTRNWTLTMVSTSVFPDGSPISNLMGFRSLGSVACNHQQYVIFRAVVHMRE